MLRILTTLATGLALAGAAQAAPAGGAAHPWLSSPLRAAQPETYFSNLKDGAQIESPFVLKFGLSRFGLAPITKAVPQAGHHHLLVDRDLPLDFDKPLPFNAQYIHFGKGQMETVLDFKPGTYKLRLLLANEKHIPYFIYSKPLTVVVTRKRDGVDPKSLIQPGVSFLAPASGETVQTPFRVVLHASGMSVGHQEITDKGVGHFRIVAERAGAPSERVTLSHGATEVWLNPPAGDYRFRLELVGNGQGEVLSTSAPIELKVVNGL
jgi:Domain of unknown function (DUF4399)